MKINKILIANRGEIALRIIRTCKEMGIKTVVLCPTAGEEHNFLETSLADEYFFLEEEGVKGYLNMDKIIDIAKKAKVDAIHPGYGFLSENWKFAQLCEKNNIKFIGPQSNLLKKFEDKIEAKAIAKKVGIPTLPASDKPIMNKKDLAMWADKIKAPFILKAQKGGGGMGIRIIENEINLGELFAISLAVQRQMAIAFSEADFFLEKYLPEVRHIEFQILSDGKNTVHLGERECTIQRRFQKLLEEAPSSFVDNKTREEMGRWAVKLISDLKYEGAATVEFLVDNEKKFYFMEVNPRIQVEHPITEAITGIDIVEQQIRIAEGELLSFKQEDIIFTGYAIEARINAEDPYKDFQPTPGVIEKYFPSGGQGVFLHSFLHHGQEIYPYFDSLLAKIIATGKTREEAINKLKRSTDEIIIQGVKTNIPFFRLLLNDKEFLSGNFNTNFIEKSGIMNELMISPLLKEKIEKKLIKETNEEELANIIFQVYEKVKKENNNNPASNWLNSERLRMID
ncbi:MAG: biotin carboxylase N-terminal domain-containing protein [Candidatus Paceibacterota bacterium]|jgi:acetyl-CoA carboxylase biotin carboxylase subunit